MYQHQFMVRSSDPTIPTHSLGRSASRSSPQQRCIYRAQVCILTNIYNGLCFIVAYSSGLDSLPSPVTVVSQSRCTRWCQHAPAGEDGLRPFSWMKFKHASTHTECVRPVKTAYFGPLMQHTRATGYPKRPALV